MKALTVFKQDGEIIDQGSSNNLPVVPRSLCNLRAFHNTPCPACGGHANTMAGWEYQGKTTVCHSLTKCECGFEFHYAEEKRLVHPVDINPVQRELEVKAERVMISGYLQYKQKLQIEDSKE